MVSFDDIVSTVETLTRADIGLEKAKIELPKTTLNHGFLTFNGQKISKSLGNSISPITLVEKYGVDAVRYFCLRQFSFASGSDGDFSETALVQRHNDELANKLGNLVSRTSALAEKYGIKKFEDQEFEKTHSTIILEKEVGKLMDKFKVDQALNKIFASIDSLNEWVQNKKPWENNDRTDRLEINQGVLYNVVQSIREIARLLSPFIPESAEKISKIFKTDKIKKAPVLFEKIEISKPNLNKQDEPKEIMEGITTIQYEDFTKLDLRVAEIKKAEEIEGADKLYKLTLNDGTKEPRTICAGIKEFYNAKDLKGKKIIIIANLAPRKLRGIESCGMLLAASTKEHKTVSLISPDQDIAPGSIVG